jgi:hypothetical protein
MAARQVGQEEKFFMFKGENYLRKVLTDSEEIEARLNDKKLLFFGVFLIPYDETINLPRSLFARCESCHRMLSKEVAFEEATLRRLSSKIRNNLEYIDPVAAKEAKVTKKLK